MKLIFSEIHTSNASAKLIQLGGWVEQVIRFKKPVKVYNHSEIRFFVETLGAVDSGVELREWGSYWNSIQPAELVDYEFELNEAQTLRLQRFVASEAGKKYEYSMFFWHTVKIFTGKWYGSTSNKRFFCKELSIKCFNYVFEQNVDPYLSPVQWKAYLDEYMKKM